MSTQDLFVAAARKCLSGRRKSLSVPPSLDLAAQVLAVDSSVKPALLYDTNSATAEQVQRYLNALQSAQLVSPSLLTLDVCGHTLIVNPLTVMSNLEELLRGGSVAVIDVCHSLEKPAITDPLRGELKVMAQDLLVTLREFPEAEKPLNVSGKCDKWNLCTLFGLLLGYPVTYWFDQNKSSDNCLAMTPLMVTTASATWSAGPAGRRCCLYSFSIPAVLHKETESNMEQWNLRLQERFQHQTVLKDLNVSSLRFCTETESNMEQWNLRLQERFQHQTVLKDLNVCQSMVTLQSVCL